MHEVVSQLVDNALDKALTSELAVLNLYQGCMDSSCTNIEEIGDINLEVKKVKNVKN